MPEYYDALETRDAAVREREQFALLSEIIARAMSAPGWAKHLAGIDPKSVTSRAALAKLPVLHKSDISALQKQNPPFGGLNVTAPGKVRRLLMSPGPIFEPEGEGDDRYGAARALYAAGFRTGDIVHNSFAYHLTPGGFILELGAHALGCAIIPGGVGNTEQQLDAIAHYRPSRLRRYARFSEDHPRHGRDIRQGRIIDQARACLGSRAPGFAPRRARPPRRCRPAMLCDG